MEKVNYIKPIFRVCVILFLFYRSVLADNLYMTNFVPDLYLGQWFEIARLPLYFENKCIPPIVAEYTKDGDDIAVRNSCMTSNSELSVANGMAYFSESSSIGKLKVTFIPKWLRFTHLGRADYWIVYTDYKYALVGSPNYKYLWILARTENYDQDRVESLVNLAKAKGYDTAKLIFNYPKLEPK